MIRDNKIYFSRNDSLKNKSLLKPFAKGTPLKLNNFRKAASLAKPFFQIKTSNFIYMWTIVDNINNINKAIAN